MTNKPNYTLEDHMVELFELLCEDFKKLLRGGEITSADRKTLLEFLKDNEISCVGSNNKHVSSILDDLPFSEDDNLTINT